MNQEITDEQLIELYYKIFRLSHSESFKICEMKDLLFDEKYTFIERPYKGWRQIIENYFVSNNIDKSILKINPDIK